MLPLPTLISAARGRTVSSHRGTTLREPWCGSLSTSARRSLPEASRSSCAASSMSPVSSTDPAGVLARITSEPSLTAVPSSPSTDAIGCTGPSTSSRRPGQPSATPRDSSTTGTAARPATAVSCRSPEAGSRTGPTAIPPAARPRSAPARPPSWSECRWVITTSSRTRTPSRSRQEPIASSVGPVSTRTACPGGPVASTSASP
ncbi:hypothetical protein AD006_13625 [Pseudonocardia sp. EC080610-09]|nr:hypothetical protein FRP1_06000 [Pseudonocardia sp. EC080625-04]ALL76086.1 hypothetical protein AD006_13625 [Pseudonocardia sp. EC080610-09]